MSAMVSVLGFEEIQELMYLRQCGFSEQNMALCFNVHQTTISKYLRKHGDPLLKPHRARYSWRWSNVA